MPVSKQDIRMNYKALRYLFTITLLVYSPPLWAQGDSVGIDFASDIKPILESNCFRCHNEENAEGGYRIDNRDDAMDYIEEGDSESSDFYLYLISDDDEELMPPPDDGGPLDDSDIKMIKDWIDEGANWPASVTLQDPDSSSAGDDSNMDDSGENSKESQTTNDERPNVYRALGLLHPATLHIPIGLLLAAGLFALLSIRGNFVMSDCAYYCLWLGTLSAIVACLTGWWFALDQYPNEYVKLDEFAGGIQNMEHKLFWHRTSALVVTGFALVLCLFAASARNRDPDDGVSWKFGAIILAMGIGYVGHEGGELSWKESHYDELWELIDEYIPGVAGEDNVDGNANASPDESSKDTTGGAGPDDVST